MVGSRRREEPGAAAQLKPWLAAVCPRPSWLGVNMSVASNDPVSEFNMPVDRG